MTDDSTQAGWRPALALFVLYLLLGTFSWSLARTDAESVAIWLGAGVLFAFFMRRRTSVPVLLAGWLAATVWGMAAHALHWAPALAFCCCRHCCCRAIAWRIRSAALVSRF